MSQENEQLKKTIWLSNAVLTLLLVINGFTLTACNPSEQEAKPTEQLEKNEPAKAAPQKDQKKEDKEDGEDKQKDDGEDKQEDDDPE
jgi:predicted small secreted protein